MLPCNFEDRRHVAGIAGVMHDQYGLGPLRDAALNGSRGDGQLVQALDVREHGRGTGVAHRVGRRHKGQRGQDDLIAGLQSDGHAGQMQRGGGIGYGDCMFGADEFSKLALKRTR